MTAVAASARAGPNGAPTATMASAIPNVSERRSVDRRETRVIAGISVPRAVATWKLMRQGRMVPDQKPSGTHAGTAPLPIGTEAVSPRVLGQSQLPYSQSV